MEAVFETLAEPNRRAILRLLLSLHQSVGEIAGQLQLPQPTVSKHLRVLREAGFVESIVDAQRRVYRLKPQPFLVLDAWLAPFRQPYATAAPDNGAAEKTMSNSSAAPLRWNGKEEVEAHVFAFRSLLHTWAISIPDGRGTYRHRWEDQDASDVLNLWLDLQIPLCVEQIGDFFGGCGLYLTALQYQSWKSLPRIRKQMEAEVCRVEGEIKLRRPSQVLLMSELSARKRDLAGIIHQLSPKALPPHSTLEPKAPWFKQDQSMRKLLRAVGFVADNVSEFLKVGFLDHVKVDARDELILLSEQAKTLMPALRIPSQSKNYRWLRQQGLIQMMKHVPKGKETAAFDCIAQLLGLVIRDPNDRYRDYKDGRCGRCGAKSEVCWCARCDIVIYARVTEASLRREYERIKLLNNKL